MTVAAESARLRAFRAGYERFVEAFNAGDFERASAALRDDYEHHFPPGFTERTVRGRDAWLRFNEEFTATVDEWAIKAHSYLEASPRCFVVEIEGGGVGRASGAPGAMRVWQVIDLDEDDRVRRVREFTDRAQALAVAGVDEPEGTP